MNLNFVNPLEKQSVLFQNVNLVSFAIFMGECIKLEASVKSVPNQHPSFVKLFQSSKWSQKHHLLLNSVANYRVILQLLQNFAALIF